MIDSVIHSVAGDYHVGLDLSQGTVQSFVYIRPWEWVIRFSESSTGFTAEPDVDELGERRDTLQSALSLNP